MRECHCDASQTDFSTMEHKLDNNQYETVEDFIDDCQLIFNNARLFNQEGSIYYKCANALEKFLKECAGGIPPDPQIEAGFADAFKDVDQTRGEVGMYPGLVRPHRNHVGPRIATNEEPDPRHQSAAVCIRMY